LRVVRSNITNRPVSGQEAQVAQVRHEPQVTPSAQLSRALVPLVTPGGQAAAEHAATLHAKRPNADFVAHLIATSGKAPQTRARRRVEPREAVAAYGATAAYGAIGRRPASPGLKLSRAL
jgi:hypothetical protein